MEVMLRSDAPEIRMRALEGLAASGSPQAAAWCIWALTDSDPDVRETARASLRQLRSDDLANAVIAVIGWGDAAEATALVTALPSLRGVLEPNLLERFQSSDTSRIERIAGAFCLGRMGSRLASEMLAQAVWSDDAELSAYCADALMNIDDPSLLRHFARMSTHESPSIRIVAYQGLARIGGPEAHRIIADAAAGKTESDTPARRIAVRMLGYVGDHTSVELLMGHIRARNQFARPAIDALATLTGLSNSLARERWIEWYDEVWKPAVEAAQRSQAPPPPLVPKQRYVPPGFPKQGFPFIP